MAVAIGGLLVILYLLQMDFDVIDFYLMLDGLWIIVEEMIKKFIIQIM